MVFIGRKEELRLFEESIDALVRRDAPRYSVFLIHGEGGIGKTTLLRKYEELARQRAGELCCVYLDLEDLRIRSEDGTPYLMRVLANSLRERDARFQAHEFEKAWEAWQKGQVEARDCSRALNQDLVSMARYCPLVILLDTWEVVHPFASSWLVRGLMFHLLSNLELGNRFIFVTAGRLPERFVMEALDALHQFRDSVHFRELMKFTPSEVKEYLDAYKILDAYGIREDPERVDELTQRAYELTRGIPLALDILRWLPQRDLESLAAIAHDRKIVQALFYRFLRHLSKSHIYRRFFYSMAMMRPTGERWLQHRSQLIRAMLGLPRPIYEWARKVEEKFSFVRSGNLTLHPDVREIIVQYLKNESESRLDAMELAERALHFCSNSRKEAREGTEEWREWTLHIIHYRFWLQKYEEGLREAIDLLAVPSHATRLELGELLNDWEEDISHRASHLARDFADLREIIENWGSPEVINRYQELAERYRIDPQRRVTTALELARRLARRGNLAETLRALKDAADNALESPPPGTAERWALLLEGIIQHILRWRSAGQEALMLGRRMVGDHPWLRMAGARIKSPQGDVLGAYIALRKARRGIEQIAPERRAQFEEQIQKMERNLQERLPGGARRAKILTMLGNDSSAYGEFSEAERYYREALSSNPEYIPAALKLIHLLRHLDRLQEAWDLLQQILRLNWTAFPNRWRAGIEEARGSLLAMEGKQEDAERSFRQAIEWSPDYANPYISLGWIYLHRRNGDNAFECLHQARTILEQFNAGPLYQVYNGLGMAQLLRNRPHEYFFEVAHSLCGKLPKPSRPYQVIAHHGLASLALREFGEANRCFEQLENFRQARGWLRTLIQDVRLLAALLPKDAQQIGHAEGILQRHLWQG